MKTLLILFLVTSSLASSPVFAKEVEVQMKSISFDPKIVKIAVGDSVVWKNVSYTDHSATGDDFDTGLIKPKDHSKAIVFSKAGSFSYNCKIHGKTMSAAIEVDAK